MAITPSLKLFNTLTRSIEDFKPLDKQNVRMYVCGITPYDDAHIGHARVYVVFDVLYRLLKHLYPKVTYVRNFTDIDDKILLRAHDANRDPADLASEMMASFEDDMAKLNVLRPDHEPRVSGYIGKIVLMVDELVAKKFAYVTPCGDVMYHSDKFPDFGKLARRDLEGQHGHARVKADSEKLNEHDFVLWKANEKSATKMEQAFEPKDFGAKHFEAAGRPGWHIECSAMSRDLLGDTFDIHGGGEDLQFPHHSCEIAQTEVLTGKPMSNFWMHAAFITVGGKKMSKSEGNFTTIKDALKTYSPEAIRLWLLQTHYRKPVDFSEAALEAVENRLRNARIKITQIQSGLSEADAEELVKIAFAKPEIKSLPQDFLNALVDDLNTPKALAVIDQTDDAEAKLNMFAFLGVNLFPAESLIERMDKLHKISPEELELLRKRDEARAAKDWEESDRLRDELLKLGIIVEDSAERTTWRRK